jgi:nucleotide-binding universal stress UspA family protein
MSILCAVDFSAASGLALTAAGRIATTFGQPLTIVTVADPLLAAAERVQLGDDPITLLTGALASFVDDTLGPGTSSRHHLLVPVGNPAAEILRHADAIDAQLIVVATQGASGVRKFVFGSVAERVLRTSTRPVLVVPPAAASTPLRTLGSMQEVLAPIDFHEYALDDARVAGQVARSSHARLRLLHVVAADDADRWTVLRQSVASQLEEQMSGARQTQVDRAREALERVAEALGGTPQPTLEVVQGSVAEQIARVADRADVDLVVLGLRGTVGVTGARVGAIAYRVLCSSPVPVLALPHEARQGQALAFLQARPHDA